MLWEEELKSLTDKLKDRSSQKDNFFFQFLIGEPLPYPEDSFLPEQALVLFAAFSIESPDMSSIAEKIRGTKPIKGMHYSSNLIEMAAFALYDLEKEVEHLKSYVSGHSTRDYFILYKLFPSVSTIKPEPKNSIDKLASHLHSGNFPLDWKELYLDAIQNAEDLLDLFVLRESYLFLMDMHPSTEYKREISFLLSQFEKTIKRVDRWTHLVIILLLIGLIIPIYIGLIPVILKDWDYAERRIEAFKMILSGVYLIIIIILGTHPDKLGLFQRFERIISSGVLRIMGVDRSKTLSMIENSDSTLTRPP